MTNPWSIGTSNRMTNPNGKRLNRKKNRFVGIICVARDKKQIAHEKDASTLFTPEPSLSVVDARATWDACLLNIISSKTKS
jgi:hypothetical protein